jgi:uncharacterized protein (DUF2147 family)
MFRKVGLVLVATSIMAGAAWADPIEGDWKTEDRSVRWKIHRQHDGERWWQICRLDHQADKRKDLFG